MNTLVLSSGGLFAAAHIGVIKYLAEKNIQVDHVVGCSGGALVAAFWALNWAPEQIVKEMQSYNWHLYDLNWLDFKSGIIKGDRILRRLRQIFPGCVGDYQITIMITSMLHGKAIAAPLDMPLADAVRASISIPAIFVPHEYGGDKFLDGGLGGLLPLEGIPKGTTKIISSMINDHMSALDAGNSIVSALYASYAILVGEQAQDHLADVKKRIPDYTEISHIFTNGNVLTSFKNISNYAKMGYDDSEKVLG